MTAAPQAAAGALVAHVTAAGAALPERAGASWLVPRATPDSVVEERLQRWRSAAGGRAAFGKLCRARGIDDPRSWVSDVTAAPGARLPGWAGQLRAFLEIAAAGAADQDRQALAGPTGGGVLFVAGVLPVPVAPGTGADALAPAVALLRRALRASRAPSKALADDLCRHFADLLLTTFAGIIVRGGLAVGRDVAGGWAALLHQYPVAGRCLGSLLEGYLGYATELCRRLDGDAEALRELAGLPAGEPVRATGCRPGAGDRHNGLRSVTVVQLAGGAQVVYKPKDLRHVGALARIADAAGCGLSLPRRLLRTGYGWEEFIGAAEPAAGGERRNAARELGAWTFLFQLLDATDILAENVRICADRVVPVDVETLFRFSFVDPADVPWLPQAATGLFSLPLLREAAHRVADAGLMAGSGRVLLDHSEEVVAGYAGVAARAARRKAAVAAEIGRAGELPVRALLRSTWVYDELLAGSLRPQALADGVARDLVLERLWLGHLRAGLPAAVVAAEVAALRRLDIPLFVFAPGRAELGAAGPVEPGEQAPPAVLFEPPLVSALARAAELGRADVSELDGLRAAMFCAAENQRVLAGPGRRKTDNRAPAPGRGRPDRSGPARHGRAGPDWAERGASAAAQSAAWLRAGGPAGAPLAAGLAYQAGNDAVVLAAARPFDLFSGIAGMALALRWLAALSGDSTVAQAAEAAQAEAAQGAQRLADDLCQRVEAGRPLRLAGAYGGLAALAALAAATGTGMHALRRCTKAMAGQDLGDTAQRPRAVESLSGLAAALGSAVAARIPGMAAAHGRAVGALRPAAVQASGSARFPSNLGMLIPSERALAAWALGGLGPPALDGTAVAGSGNRLVAAALDPGALRPLPPGALGGLGTLGVLAELEVSLVGSRRDGRFADAAEAAGAILLARHDATSRWFGDSLAPDRFRLSAVWGTTAAAHLLTGLAAPSRFCSIRLFEPVAPER